MALSPIGLCSYIYYNYTHEIFYNGLTDNAISDPADAYRYKQQMGKI